MMHYMQEIGDIMYVGLSIRNLETLKRFKRLNKQNKKDTGPSPSERPVWKGWHVHAEDFISCKNYHAEKAIVHAPPSPHPAPSTPPLHPHPSSPFPLPRTPLHLLQRRPPWLGAEGKFLKFDFHRSLENASLGHKNSLYVKEKL